MTKPNVHTCQAIVRVGGGRGFVVEYNRVRLVVTAAHCLSLSERGYVKLTPAHCTHEKIYQKLLSPLSAEPTVWCECRFVNPVADIAVLGCPEDQGLLYEIQAYNELVDNVRPLAITDAPKMRGYTPGMAAAYLLSLDGEWCKCTVERSGFDLRIKDQGVVAGGMSGSPLVSMKGKAIGLVSTDDCNPTLRDNLPAWFFC